MNNKKETRQNLFTGTFFPRMDLKDKDGHLRNPKIKSEVDALIHMLQYMRYFVVKNVKSLDYVIIAIHDGDIVAVDSKELDDDGKPKYQKGDVKALHIHVAFKFLRNQGKTLSAVSKQLVNEFNAVDTKRQIETNQRHVEEMHNEGDYLDYLTHSNHEEKTPYGRKNLMIFKINHRKNGKVKDVINEDFDYYENNNPMNFWVTGLNKYLMLGQGGKEHVNETPQPDNFDRLAKYAAELDIQWHGSAKEFDKAECRLERQNGEAYKWFLGYRSKFKRSTAVINVQKGGIKGGSSVYHGQLKLNTKGDDVSEIDQICYDLQRGKISLSQVQDILTDDFGAKGSKAWDQYKNNIFKEAVMDFVKSKVADIDDIDTDTTRQLSTFYTSGYGGSGKDLITKTERQLLTGESKTQKMTMAGKKKTPDLFKEWDNLLNSTGSDIDGSSFNCHEFTQVFDTDTAPSSASGRNNNSPYLPNFVWFTNSDPLRKFVTDSMTHSDREKYAKYTLNDKGNKVYDYGHLNDYEYTKNMRKQILRRIPYYQQFRTDPWDRRIQTCRLFMYVPTLSEHVLYDEFKCRVIDTIPDAKGRKVEAKRIATRLADDIRAYDFGGFFGETKKMPYEKMYKVYDFETDHVKNIDLNKIFFEQISDYHRDHRIARDIALSKDQERELFGQIKYDAQKKYAEFVNNADFENRELAEKCQFYINILSEYDTPLEAKKREIKNASDVVNLSRYAKNKINNGHEMTDEKLKNLDMTTIARNDLNAQCVMYYGLNGFYANLISAFGNQASLGHENLTFEFISKKLGSKKSIITTDACDVVITRLTRLMGLLTHEIVVNHMEEAITFDFSNPKYLPVADDVELKNLDFFVAHSSYMKSKLERASKSLFDE